MNGRTPLSGEQATGERATGEQATGEQATGAISVFCKFSASYASFMALTKAVRWESNIWVSKRKSSLRSHDSRATRTSCRRCTEELFS